MAKCILTIGYSISQETEPGIWNPEIVEKQYRAQQTRNRDVNAVGSDKINSDITFNMSFSMLVDMFAVEHSDNILYVKLLGKKYKIVSLSFAYPRLNITVGGVYNE